MNDALFDTLLKTRKDGPVKIEFIDSGARFNLRIATKNLKAASEAFGVSLPKVIGKRTTSDNREALCVGPDEWVLKAPANDEATIVDAFSGIYQTAPHSLVSLSDREISLSLSGDKTLRLLEIGCPADPSQIAVGNGVRTLFDAAQIVLYRDGEHDYRMNVWRSFAPHVWDLLNTGNQELSSGF